MLGLEIAGGVVTLVALILGTVFAILGAVMRKRVAAAMAEAQAEGVVLDSGLRGGSVRYRNYRAPGYYASRSYRSARRRLVLTRAHLFMLTFATQRIPRAELRRYHASVEDGALRLWSDEPLGATGHIDLRVRVDDPAAWVSALRAAGAAE